MVSIPDRAHLQHLRSAHGPGRWASSAKFPAPGIAGEPFTIYGDGSQTRTFCYVDDLIDGIYRLFISDEHVPVNIGNPVETASSNSPARSTADRQQSWDNLSRGLRGEGDPQRRQPDITRAQQILDWQPKIDLEEGLRRTIPYFKEKLGLT